MKKIINLILLSAFSIAGVSQTNTDARLPVNLKTGTQFYPKNINSYITNNKTEQSIEGRYYKFVQFNAIPSQEVKENMIANGMRFQEYIPMNTYLVSFPSNFSKSKLKSYGVRSVINVLNSDRITLRALSTPYPKWAIQEDEVQLYISFYQDLNFLECIEKITPHISTIKGKYEYGNKVMVSVNSNSISKLLKLNYIRLVDLISEPGKPEHELSRNMHRSTLINAFYNSGRKYNGEGVVVGVNDDGIVGPHIDFKGRMTQPGVTANGSVEHSDMVTGIVGGTGNLDPTMAGMATACDLIVREYAGTACYINTVAVHTADSAVIFNSSYSNGCNAGYTSLARQMDREARLNPTLIQIFSAGNSNNTNCGYGAGSTWGNITGGHKQAKNVIATANLESNMSLATSSSRGPADDGRIKPDIAAHGNGNYSTNPNNTYRRGSGTSAASPSIAGVMAQLYHAYKVNNSGVTPEAALMKTIILNTAEDFGNTGPDFKYGWGRVHALRAVEAIENNRYLSGSISNGGNNSHSIVVPANVKEVKVMVYWHDYEASTSASKALVNNLDTKIEYGPSTYMPWLLDHTPTTAALNSPATKGVDSINNVEQVSILNPTSGTYTLKVAGTSVPQGPQKYFVSYDFIYDEVKLINPNGGEGYVPGVAERLFWDAYGNTSNFTLSYSVDSGSTWSPIGTSGATSRYRDWSVPNSVTGKALVRIVSGSRTDISDHTFSIISKPTNLRVDTVCPTFMKVSWNPVAGADQYQVFLLGDKFMDSVGRTSGTSFNIPITNALSEQWFSVSAIKNNNSNNVGRRADAKFYAGGLLNCVLALDAGISAVTSPNGLSCNSGSSTISIRATNYGTSTLSSIPVKYQVNNGTVQSGTISASLSTGNSTVYSFPTTYNFTTAGFYTIKAWTELTGEQFFINDSIEFVYDYFPTRTLPYTENFNSFTNCSLASDCEDVECSLTRGYVNLENRVKDDIDWRVNSGFTPSGSTGPSGDHTSGSAKYIYLEASGTSCDLKEGIMESPCIDLGTASSPILTFWYHMYGASMDTLRVDVYDGTTWNLNMFKIGGNQNNIWKRGDINLSSFSGNIVKLRFRGRTGNNYTSDIAIDDINISNLTSIDEKELSNSVSVYPNPNNGEFNLSIDNARVTELTVSVFDIYGRLVHQEQVTDKLNLIKLNDVASGVYSVRIDSGEQSTTKKIVVN